jgi:hypothetical protein
MAPFTTNDLRSRDSCNTTTCADPSAERDLSTHCRTHPAGHRNLAALTSPHAFKETSGWSAGATYPPRRWGRSSRSGPIAAATRMSSSSNRPEQPTSPPTSCAPNSYTTPRDLTPVRGIETASKLRQERHSAAPLAALADLGHRPQACTTMCGVRSCAGGSRALDNRSSISALPAWWARAGTDYSRRRWRFPSERWSTGCSRTASLRCRDGRPATVASDRRRRRSQSPTTGAQS